MKTLIIIVAIIGVLVVPRASTNEPIPLLRFALDPPKLVACEYDVRYGRETNIVASISVEIGANWRRIEQKSADSLDVAESRGSKVSLRRERAGAVEHYLVLDAVTSDIGQILEMQTLFAAAPMLGLGMPFAGHSPLVVSATGLTTRSTVNGLSVETHAQFSCTDARPSHITSWHEIGGKKHSNRVELAYGDGGCVPAWYPVVLRLVPSDQPQASVQYTVKSLRVGDPGPPLPFVSRQGATRVLMAGERWLVAPGKAPAIEVSAAQYASMASSVRTARLWFWAILTIVITCVTWSIASRIKKQHRRKELIT